MVQKSSMGGTGLKQGTKERNGRERKEGISRWAKTTGCREEHVERQKEASWAAVETLRSDSREGCRGLLMRVAQPMSPFK